MSNWRAEMPRAGSVVPRAGAAAAAAKMTYALPSMKPRKVSFDDPRDMVYLIYGPPKMGKTTVVSTFPNVLFLATERGYKFITSPVIRLSGWSRNALRIKPEKDIPIMPFTAAHALILADAKKARPEIDYVAIDTGDKLYEMCFADKLIDFGKPEGEPQGDEWNQIKSAWSTAVDEIGEAGKGVILVFHQKLSSGKEMETGNVERTLSIRGSNTVAELANGRADLILRLGLDPASYNPLRKEHTRRVAHTRASLTTLAGGRMNGFCNMPPKIEMPNPESGETFFEKLTLALQGALPELPDLGFAGLPGDAIEEEAPGEEPEEAVPAPAPKKVWTPAKKPIPAKKTWLKSLAASPAKR